MGRRDAIHAGGSSKRVSEHERAVNQSEKKVQNAINVLSKHGYDAVLLMRPKNGKMPTFSGNIRHDMACSLAQP